MLVLSRSAGFDMLARFIDDETADPADMDWRGMMAAIGIQKDKLFPPTGLFRDPAALQSDAGVLRRVMETG